MTKTSAARAQDTEPDKLPIDLTPSLGDHKALFLEFCQSALEQMGSESQSDLRSLIERERDMIIPDTPVERPMLGLLFAKSVFLDLVAQGWELEATSSSLIGRPPNYGLSREEAKTSTRNGHLLGRDSQLKERSVRDFVKSMERRRQTRKGWHNIFSLMRDGNELSQKLQAISAVADNQARGEQLNAAISPYLQFVEAGATCKFTGLKLTDIWRYFRHTWVNEYKSVPGRSMMILVRDAAAPNHPVIGIAALGSSVVQSKLRDGWIGWLPSEFVSKALESGEIQTEKFRSWCRSSLDRLISDVYRKDLVAAGIVAEEELDHPSESTIGRLLEFSTIAINKHRKEPQKSAHKSAKVRSSEANSWEPAAETFLFRSKRSKHLAQLLSIRKDLQEFDTKGPIDQSRIGPKFKGVVAQLIRFIKAEHVGVNMMDITVCGAIAPYNSLLGGKLVCLLLCSPEVVTEYRRRYSKRPSIIASSMKGSPVLRPADLVLLCTTSLYGNSNSQYNRVRIPLRELGLNSDESIAYKNLKYRTLRKSTGFGTYQFSQLTIQLGSDLEGRKANRTVNSIFGEGVNPLMRRIRDALSSVGFPAERLLLHGSQRTNYGIALASNFREVLLGRAKRPNYYLEAKNGPEKTRSIAKYWVLRWLDPRLKKEGILSEVEKHNLVYPIRHGALVPLPELPDGYDR